jgi:hypothetical protein
VTGDSGSALAAGDGEGGWLNAQETAGRAGVRPGTWRAYVARGHAPKHERRNPVTGVEEWADAAVGEWLAGRPGQGARTDRKS